MNEADRIRLAEAIYKCVGGCDHESYTVGCPVHDSIAFRPFTDANDDYAVLEWMRNGRHDHPEIWVEFKRLNTDWLPFHYEIGDYARAALKVLDND